MTTTEGGSDFDREIATLDLVEVAGDDASGWAVAAASSTSVVIDSPAAAALTGPSIAVSGRGHGFEATVELEVRSAVDGSRLYEGSTSAGNLGVLEPFATSVPLAGWDRVWIIARSAGGADGVASSFAAVPVTVTGPAEDATYLVTGVALDDVDGGLNLRSAPGADSDRIGVLEWGRPVVRTPDAYPVVVGDDVWWPVTASDGVAGWVNARFLARAGEIPGGALTAGAQAFLFATADPAIGGRWAPISDRTGFVVAADGAVVSLTPGALAEPSGWTSPVVGGASLVDLAAVPDALQAEAVITPFGASSTGAGPPEPEVQELANQVFAGLPGATVEYNGVDGLGHTLHLFFEQAPVGPRIVGAIIDLGR